MAYPFHFWGNGLVLISCACVLAGYLPPGSSSGFSLLCVVVDLCNYGDLTQSMVFHHLLSLAAYSTTWYGGAIDTTIIELSNLSEISTMFLVVYKEGRTPLRAILFFVSFVLCRIVWLPIMTYKWYYHWGGREVHRPTPVLTCLIVWIALNLFWMREIVDKLKRVLYKREKERTD